MSYETMSIVKCKKNKGNIQKILHLYQYPKSFFSPRGRLAHPLEMSTGHFLNALPL